MTNTLNTPAEVSEINYPLRVNQYALRKVSGGKGEHSGGECMNRSYALIRMPHLALLTERRKNNCGELMLSRLRQVKIL